MEENKRSSSLMNWRRSAGISRVQLAVALSVSAESIAKWEQGQREPHLPLWKYKLWADLCGCTLEDLLRSFPPPQEHELINQLKIIQEHMQQAMAV
jgi:transcriptional regulator with XRE-family HTH domain